MANHVREGSAIPIVSGGEPTTAWRLGRLSPMPATVPVGWELVPALTVARLESGHTPSRQHPEYWAGDIPWVSLHDSKRLDVREIFETSQTIGELGLANSSARLLPRGTVVFSRTATVGKATVLGREMSTSQDFANFVCGPRLHNFYLMQLFRALQPEWKRLMAGSTHNTIYMPVFRDLQVLLPPLAEQRKIAAILSAVDETIEKTEAVIDQLQVVKKAMMEELLTRGMPGRHTRFKQTEIGDIPEGWEVVRGERLFELRGGYGPSDLMFDPGGDALFLKVDDFNDRRNARRLSVAALRFSASQNPGIRTYPAGSLVFPKRGAAIFKNRVGILAAFAAVDPNLMILLPSDALDSKYFALALTRIGLHNLSDNSGIPQLNNKHLYPYPFGVPSLAEQREIAATIGAIDECLWAEANTAERLRASKTALSRALLSGDLRVTPDEAPP